MTPQRRKRLRTRREGEGQELANIIWLNVGGREYVTSKSTLQNISDSMLATLISTSLPSAMVNGAYFIDRDPDMFAYVLEYLRASSVELPCSAVILRQLEKEAEYFMLPGLLQQVRSKLHEVCVEVKLHYQPFGCSETECNCGDGGLDLEAYSYVEVDEMDADMDYLKHPKLKPECELCFGMPSSIVCVELRKHVPRSSEEVRIKVELGHRGSGLSFLDMMQLTEEQIAEAHGDCGCNGEYWLDGALNQRNKYKNANGAIIWFGDGQWKASKEDNMSMCLFSTTSIAMTPPSGKWAGDKGGWCLVEGEDHPRVEEASAKTALKAVVGALSALPLGTQDREELMKPVVSTLKGFVETRGLKFHVIFQKVGSYYVGDKYDKRDQRRHFRAGVKLEFNLQNTANL